MANREPLFELIQRELQARGWTLMPTVGHSPLAPLYRDPEGNLYAGLTDAVMAQGYREIAQAVRREHGFEEARHGES